MAAVRGSAVESGELSSTCITSSTTSTNNSSGRPPQDSALASHQSLLNGTRPNPFVHDGVPAAPCPDDSLPPGALVNGPASHRPSEEPNVPDEDPQPHWSGAAGSPRGSQPPSQLQSDTRRKPEGRTLEVRPERASPGSDRTDGHAPAGGGEDGRPDGAREGAETGSSRDVDSEASESSSDDCGGLNGGLQEKFIRFLFESGAVGSGAGKEQTEEESVSRRKQKTRRRGRTLAEEKAGDRSSLSEGDSGLDVSVNEGHVWRRKPGSLDPLPGNSRGTATVVEAFVPSESVGTDAVEEGISSGGEPALSKRSLETSEEAELSFFRCTKCNVNFKERRHLHRHMMYHLDGHNQVGQGSRLRTFICRECGRSFCERSSLHKHVLIHQARRERLMREIKGLIEPQDEDPNDFVSEDPDGLVRHARTHGKAARNTAARGRSALHGECQSKSAQSRFDTFLCKICTFKTKNRNVLKRHLALVHEQRPSDHQFHLHSMAVDRTRSAFDQDMLTGQTEAQSWPALLLKPKFLTEQERSRAAGLPLWSNGLSDLYVRNEDTQKSHKGLNSPLIKCSFGSLANNLSPSSMRCDKPSKLSLPTERMDVTTGLPYVEEDNCEYENSISEQKTEYLDGFDVHVMTEAAIYGKTARLTLASPGTSTSPPTRGGAPVAVQRKSLKSPSKRKMSIPYHNTHLVVPKHEPESPEQQDLESLQGLEYNDTSNTSGAIRADQSVDADYCTDATAVPSDSFVQRGFPFKTEDSCDSELDHDGDAEDSDEICTLIVKEESIESAVSGDVVEPGDRNHTDGYVNYPASPLYGTERKSCPYCPAVFESGVGLSNHVRGHLHRMGLSYDARHMLSPEQVATQDRQPRVRRRAPTLCKRNRRADKPESQTEHTCPLCLGWFDTKTGLSNHVRGHLKRLGKPISGISKSPLCILTELLQDEEERRNVLCTLDDGPHLSRPFISQKFVGSEGLFLTPAGVPVKVQRPPRLPELGRHPAGRVLSGDGKRRKRSVGETHGIGETPSSTLVDLLKRRRLDQELEVPGQSEAARTRLIMPRSKTAAPAEPHKELSSRCSPEKFEINKKICIHCNATFHSAVSLSNHLRAYARRKRLALLDGKSYDCNQKRTRSQPGPKRKVFPTPHQASDVIHTLTCRFCDLVFQGPQSVQEDWVKHLQRHLMQTSVPGTGVGMAEVAGVGMAEVAGVGLAEVAGVGMAEVAGVGMAEVAGVGMAEVADVGMAEVAGVGMAEVMGVGMAEVTAVCEELGAPSLDVLPLNTLTQEFF